MLISLNWIREFVDLPADLSADALAEQFTLIAAEVEGVEKIEVGAKGLVCAEITSLKPVSGTDSTHAAELNLGDKTVQTCTNAPDLSVGDRVVYATTGAHVNALGTINDTTVGGLPSAGMILPGDALGVEPAAREAIFLSPNVAPGTELPGELFDDWVIEVDNHSINHRPDLWGHYGIAREFAAIFKTKLKPYPVVSEAELTSVDLPEIPITIDDGDACPRYSGLRMTGVTGQPAPLWMQLRLGHVGIRPISCLVDLTNYIMLELGQPMHAFDGDTVTGIEVGFLKPGAKFTTLDNIERTLPDQALMILSDRKPVALAGVMGGADTEISDETRTILLESANFHPHIIRKCAAALSHRTDASARFEKSLDPAHTTLAIQRFVTLARDEFAEFALASKLSDAYPKPLESVTVTVDPAFVARFMGHPVTREQVTDILTALEFKVRRDGDNLIVDVPSFRATRDIEIEADIIEEVARYVGYNNIEPDFPEVTIRALDPNLQQRIEKRALQLLTQSFGCCEIFRYLWYDTEFLNRIKHDPGPCITLRNPAAAGLERFRQSLIPGLLSAAELNRHHLDAFRLCELGTAFPRVNNDHDQRRHIGMITALKSKKAEDQLLAELKGLVDAWSWQLVNRPATFTPADIAESRQWENSPKTAAIYIAGQDVGRIGIIPLELRRNLDEHLAAWSMAWAEIHINPLATLDEPPSKLDAIPQFPEVELDFSALVDATGHYDGVRKQIAAFGDDLLRRITFVDSYEGKSIPDGKRALTFRARIGDPSRTLTEEDLTRFRAAFEKHLTANGMELRQ